MLDVPAIRKGALLLASVTVAVLYLWGLGGYGFLDPDEGMYAEIAREMLASGDWVVPRFDGVPYIEKPPLLYWLTAGTYAVLGASEFSARLWKVLPMLGAIGMTYALGRRLFSEAVGALAALILATTLGTFLFSRITQMDPLLVFAITLSVYGIVSARRPIAERNDPQSPEDCLSQRRQGRQDKPLEFRLGGLCVLARCLFSDQAGKPGWAPSLWFWMGIVVGVMSKGLPGLVIPTVLLGLWVLCRRETTAIGGVWNWWIVILATALVLPWHVAAASRVPGFFEFYVMDNQVMRFLGGRAYVEDGKSLGTLAYLGITIYALVPWAPYLGAAVMALFTSLSREGSGVRREGTTSPDASRFTFRDSRLQFLVGWIALVAGAFALSSFKLEYYALPGFPAVALLVAAFLASVDHARRPGSSVEQNRPAAPLVREEMPFRLLRFWTWVALVSGLLYTAALAGAWWAGYFTPQNIVRALSLWATNYRVMLEQGLPLPPVSPGHFGAPLLGGGLLWIGGFAAALSWLRRGKVLPAILVVAVVGAGLSVVAASVLRLVESHHSLKPLAERLNGAMRAEDVLVHERGLEKGGGLLFYTGRKSLVLNGTRGDLEFGSRLPGYERTFIDTDAFRNLWASGSRVFLVTDLPRTRSAIAQVSGPVPIMLASTGTRWLYSNRMP